MYSQARVFIRTALVNKGLPVLPWLWTWRLPHVYMLLYGWTVQLAMG